MKFRWVIFKVILVIDGWGILYKIVLRWQWLDITGDKPALVQGNGLMPSGNKPLPEPMLT